jgi:hypothetical protein
MKFLSYKIGNSALTLTLLLLATLLGSGAVSAFVGFKVGSDALKGVNSQPDTNPTKKIANKQKESLDPTDFVPLDEKKILNQVYDRTHASNKEKTEKDKDKNQDKNKDKNKPKKEASQPQQKKATNVNFPIEVEDSGVSFAILKSSQQGGSLVLDVKLSNKSKAPVRFLYSFLEVTDTQGRPLSAIAEGLPGELPASGENFTGTIKIPLELLDEERKISLNLTDYPAQKLKLNISDIPVN